MSPTPVPDPEIVAVADVELDFQLPAPAPGADFPFRQVAQIYAEGCRCMDIKAFTAAAHLFRKLLFRIAVVAGLHDKRAVTFAEVLDFLDQTNVIPRNDDFDGADLDPIRTSGSSPAHDLTLTPAAHAHAVMSLVTAILRDTYQLPDVAQSKRADTPLRPLPQSPDAPGNPFHASNWPEAEWVCEWCEAHYVAVVRPKCRTCDAFSTQPRQRPTPP